MRRPDDLEGPTLRREAIIDPVNDITTTSPAQPLVLELRDSKGDIRRWCLIDANFGNCDIIIGRSPECDLPYWWLTGLDIRLPRVSRRHAALRMIDKLLYITDLESKNGTFVSVKRVGKQTVAIEDGEEVDLGREFAFRIRKIMDPDLQCVVLQPVKPQGSKAISVLIVSGASVGNSAECGIAVNDPTVSKRHAEVVLQESSFWLKVKEGGGEVSIGSKSLKLNEMAKIQPRDIIRLGQIRINVHDYNPKGEAQWQ